MSLLVNSRHNTAQPVTYYLQKNALKKKAAST